MGLFVSDSDPELLDIQADVAAAVCDKTCLLYAPVSSSDKYGSTINSWPTITATTVCGMRPPSANELQNYDYRIGDKAAYHVDFPIGTVLDEQWHAVIEGQTLEVHILLTPQSIPTLLGTICAEIKE